MRKHSEKLKVVCPEKENLAKLIDEIDLGISQYGTLQSCALPTPRDQSIIRLVDLIDGLGKWSSIMKIKGSSEDNSDRIFLSPILFLMIEN